MGLENITYKTNMSEHYYFDLSYVLRLNKEVIVVRVKFTVTYVGENHTGGKDRILSSNHKRRQSK